MVYSQRVESDIEVWKGDEGREGNARCSLSLYLSLSLSLSLFSFSLSTINMSLESEIREISEYMTDKDLQELANTILGSEHIFKRDGG